MHSMDTCIRLGKAAKTKRNKKKKNEKNGENCLRESKATSVARERILFILSPEFFSFFVGQKLFSISLKRSLNDMLKK